MKYLCLVYYDEKTLDAMPESEFDAFAEEHFALDEALRKTGQCLLAEALQPVHTATTVQLRNGKLSTTDGPFAETKEQLGGFYMIDAKDPNDAIQIAARIPSARLGRIEVRPIWDRRQEEPRARRR